MKIDCWRKKLTIYKNLTLNEKLLLNVNSNHVSLYTNGIVHARKKIMDGKNGYGIKSQRRRVWVGEFFFRLTSPACVVS